MAHLQLTAAVKICPDILAIISEAGNGVTTTRCPHALGQAIVKGIVNIGCLHQQSSTIGLLLLGRRHVVGVVVGEVPGFGAGSLRLLGHVAIIVKCVGPGAVVGQLVAGASCV